MTVFLEYALPVLLVCFLAFPLGIYISKVMSGERVFASRVVQPIERFFYKLASIDQNQPMTWKRYLFAVLVFSGIGFVFLFALCLCQGFLPGNPNQVPGMSWDLAFNTAISFVTNTNWQSYSGESQMSFLTQALGLTVQNFVSAGTGIAVMFAIIRGFQRTKTSDLGNFWVDLTRITLYVLLPLSLVVAVYLVSQGTVQSYGSHTFATLLEPIVLDSTGQVVQGANVVDGVAYLNGSVLSNVTLITQTLVPQGLSASQVAIKMLGSNGGGYFGANSAHPFENPTWGSNLVELISILLIPVALVFSFGREVKDKKQGRALLMAMGIMLVFSLITVALAERYLPTALNSSNLLDSSFGNMEGKEVRFGVVNSSLWAVFTTATSNGSVNSMLDSFTSLGGLVLMILMQIGEVVFGGVGSGIYGMLSFVILTVFIAGLMVGRTPEYLGKKIEPYEMKWSVIAVLATPVAILVGCGIAVMIPNIASLLTNSGPHGFSEILYAFSSAGANNGSAFAGLYANTVFLNVALALCMMFGRFIPIVGMLAVSGRMATKSKVAVSEGTLSTTSPLFVSLLIFVIMLVGALSFFPAWSLGPIAELLS